MKKDIQQFIDSRVEDLYKNTNFIPTIFCKLTGYIVIAADFDGNIIAYNDDARHIYGYEPGEVIDKEDIGIAITAAETGHLVLGTLHSTNAPQTINRIIDIFPSEQQSQIKLQLSQALEAILTQVLLTRINREGSVAAIEILLASSAVRNLIREQNLHELKSIMQISRRDGMQTRDQALVDLVKNTVVTFELAEAMSSQPKQFKAQVDAMSAACRAERQ